MDGRAGGPPAARGAGRRGAAVAAGGRARLLDRFRELLTVTDYRGGCPIVAGVADASWDSPAVTDGARAAFATWLAPLQEVLVRGGVPADRAARLALLVVSAAEGALVLSRARRDFDALDAVQTELDLLLAV